MLKLANYDIVFQEIPGEVTLALNLSNCPVHCPCCHSQYLWENTGEDLNEEALTALLELYSGEITCICFMGGDTEPEEVSHLCDMAKQFSPALKTAWYSGRETVPEWACKLSYLKTGSYIEALGGLSSPTTNQRFYIIEEGTPKDSTDLFRKPSPSGRM